MWKQHNKKAALRTLKTQQQKTDAASRAGAIWEMLVLKMDGGLEDAQGASPAAREAQLDHETPPSVCRPQAEAKSSAAPRC